MRNRINGRFPCLHSPGMVVLFSLCCLLGVSGARAGLTMEMDLVLDNYSHYFYGNNNYFYYFFPNLSTNTAPPAVPFGTYYVTSPGWPTNGASALYRYDASGFNEIGGGDDAFGVFDAPDFNDSFIQNITNGQWSIFVTNAITTNVYYFSVTANIDSNSMPQVLVTFPANTAIDVPTQPTVAWQGPTNYSDLVLYEGPSSIDLPATQTSYFGLTLAEGPNDLTVHYDLYSTNAVVCSMPLDRASNALSSWVSVAHFQDISGSQFAVGSADTAGTAHTLVAYFTWDNTNANGTASGADSSGNGLNMNFSGSLGAAGGVNWTMDSEVGAGAIQFHDGDGNSAGYAGWNPTHTNLLAALAGSFSVSCWLSTTQSLGNAGDYAYNGAGIVSAYTGGVANDVIPLALNGGHVAFDTGGSGDDTLTSSGGVNDGNYHHVVVTRNQLTGQKIIYIDGVLDSFGSGTTNLLTDSQLLTVGALAEATDTNATDATYDNGYDGLVDDLQIYSGVLSSNEVAYLYANPGTTLTNTTGGSTVTNSIAVTAAPLAARRRWPCNSPARAWTAPAMP